MTDQPKRPTGRPMRAVYSAMLADLEVYKPHTLHITPDNAAHIQSYVLRLAQRKRMVVGTARVEANTRLIVWRQK